MERNTYIGQIIIYELSYKWAEINRFRHGAKIFLVSRHCFEASHPPGFITAVYDIFSVCHNQRLVFIEVVLVFP